ncbi:MAG: TlpA family protein disulfide reductase [Phycisphaerales bacterium]|nr:redoxin family protein [Planctomycetota bacterium]MCH8508823.1 TlpA family protein disulfide reductase [Phycisphaerales bacterium]
MLARLAACIALLTAPALAQPAIGDRSPELGIEELLNAPPGAEATLEALKGKFVLLEFWATWCGPCVAAIPHLNELYETFGDRMVFISVTNEGRDTVEAFQKNEPVIANWIGIDADRSLFDAYKVRGIPTTIILDAEGRVVARTHPARLTSERMEAYLAGERDEPSVVPSIRTEGETEEQLEALASRGTRPGVDPYHPSETAPETILVIRKALLSGQGATSSRSGDAGTMINASPAVMLRMLYNLPESELDLSAIQETEDKYDLIFAGIDPGIVRAQALQTLGLEEHREQRTMTAYRIIAGPDGLRGTTTLPHSGFNTMGRGQSIQFTSSSVPVSTLAWLIEGRLGLPVEVGIDPDTRFAVNLALPMSSTAEEIEPVLTKAHGITLEPFETEREVVVIRPARRAAAPE